MRNTLIQYMNDKRGKRRGVIACIGRDPNANKDPYAFYIGLAYCNPRDTFHKKTGVAIAIGRAYAQQCAQIPQDMITTTSVNFERMMERAQKYYKA